MNSGLRIHASADTATPANSRPRRRTRGCADPAQPPRDERADEDGQRRSDPDDDPRQLGPRARLPRGRSRNAEDRQREEAGVVAYREGVDGERISA